MTQDAFNIYAPTLVGQQPSMWMEANMMNGTFATPPAFTAGLGAGNTSPNMGNLVHNLVHLGQASGNHGMWSPGGMPDLQAGGNSPSANYLNRSGRQTFRVAPLVGGGRATKSQILAWASAHPHGNAFLNEDGQHEKRTTPSKNEPYALIIKVPSNRGAAKARAMSLSTTRTTRSH